MGVDGQLEETLQVPQITAELNQALYFARGRCQLDIQLKVAVAPKRLQHRPHPHGLITQEAENF
jgi:hypothetical protein